MSDTESNDSDQGSPSVTTSGEQADLSDDERDQLEKDREERLDPENRPVNAVVDNSGREFDAEKEEFKYAAGEEPGAEEETTAVIGADRPEGVESDADED